MYLDEIRLNSEQHNDVIVLSQKCQNHKAQLKHGYDALYCTSYLVQWRPEMSKELRIEESECLACPFQNLSRVVIFQAHTIFSNKVPSIQVAPFDDVT